LKSISVVYAAPVGPGPAEIDVSVLRRGRSVSQVSASMRTHGAAAGMTGVAVFGAARESYEYADLVMPEVVPPGPPRALTTPDPDGWNPYWEPGSADERAVLGARSPTEWKPSSLCGSWYRFDEPPMRADGTLDPLAVVAFGDTMPRAVRERMGFDPALPRSTSVSADFTVHLLAPARSEWLLGVNRCHGVSEGYASVELQLWDELGTLVGFATGVLILLFPDGPPPDDKRRPPG
jgi:acyl-CoA thioesterase